MQVFLIGSGPFDAAVFKKFVQEKQQLDSESVYIGVDLGALRLKRMGYPLTMAIGDFDSVAAAELAPIRDYSKEFVQLKMMKDDTDTEVALDLVMTRWPTATFYYFGGLGGRLDHTLSNIWLAFKTRYSPAIERLFFIGDADMLQFLLPGQHCIEQCREMKYLSFIALSPITDLTLTNVMYPLENYDMKFPLALISNEFSAATMTCHFRKGILVAIQTRDPQ